MIKVKEIVKLASESGVEITIWASLKTQAKPDKG